MLVRYRDLSNFRYGATPGATKSEPRETHRFGRGYLHDPRLLDLVSRVRCIASAEADAHEKDYNLCDFEIVLKSGAQKSVRVEYHRGHPRNPMTDAEMEEKFRSLARRHLPTEQVDALLRRLWTLEARPNAGTLVEMTKV